jgi:hypothetical protein
VEKSPVTQDVDPAVCEIQVITVEFREPANEISNAGRLSPMSEIPENPKLPDHAL